jgi:hypothetical protein
MEVLLHVTTPDGARIGASLAGACTRAGIVWGCFLTNDGVRALADSTFVATLRPAARAVACEHSWHQHVGNEACPLELGSQTVNSALMAEARRVVSL